MGKNIIITFTLLILFQIANAQSPYIDSLILVTESERTSVKDRIECLITLCFATRMRDTDKALEYGKEAVELAEFYNDETLIASTTCGYGETFILKSEFDKTIKYSKQSLEIASRLNIPKLIRNNYSQLSHVYSRLGDYPTALDFELKALEISRTMDNEKYIAKSLNNLGSINFNIGKLEEALKYYEESLAIKEKIGDRRGMSNSMNNIAGVLNNLKQYDKALDYNKRALVIRVEDEDIIGIASSYNSLADIESERKNYDAAIEYLFLCLKHLNQAKAKRGLQETHYKLALSYYYNNDLAKSKIHLDTSYTYAKASDNLQGLYIYHKHNSDILAKEKRYEESYAELLKSTELKDSIDAQDNTKEFKKIETIYEVKQKASEIETLQENQTLKDEVIDEKNKLLLISILGSLSLIILLYQNSRKNKLIKLKNEQLTLQNSVIEKQNKKLQKKNTDIEYNNKQLMNSNQELQQFASIASHDLKTPIRTIVSYTGLIERKYANLMDDTGRVYLTMVQDAGKRMNELLRDLLKYATVGTSEADFKSVDLNKILKNIKADLQSLIQETNATIDVADLPNIQGIPSNMTQLFMNFINNSIKFTAPNVKPHIIIDVVQKNGFHQFSVKDNGIGIPELSRPKVFEIFNRAVSQSSYEGSGIGLAICKKIIDKMNGEIWLESEVNVGTTIFFTIPIKPMAEKSVEKEVEAVNS